MSGNGGQNEMLEAALAYARMGWPVFPCSPSSKAPLTPKASAPGKKDGGHWLASLEEKKIRAWWKRWPKAMIGVPTGLRSGFVAIDLDPREHGADEMLASLRKWSTGGRALPACAVSRTRSGGLHLLFAMPAETNEKGNPCGNKNNLFKKIEDVAPPIASHVDVRGEGGYIIVPPSRMAEGTGYEWEVEPDGALPELPERLRKLILREDGFGTGKRAAPERDDRLRSAATGGNAVQSGNEAEDDAVAKYVAAALINQRRKAATAGQGERNQALYLAALALGNFISAGALSEGLVKRELRDAAAESGLSGDDGEEATLKTIESGIEAGKAHPFDFSEIRAKARRRAASRSTSSARAAASPRAHPGKRDGRASARPHESSPGEPDLAPAPPIGDEGGSTDPHGYEGGGDYDGDGHEGAGGSEAASGGNGGRNSVPLGRTGDGWGDGRFEYCAAQPQNDTGNGKRLLARHGDDLLWVREVGPHFWDANHWEVTGGLEAATRAAQETAAAIAMEANWLSYLPHEEAILEKAAAAKAKAESERSEDDKALIKKAAEVEDALENRQKTRRKFAVASGNSSKINGMIAQAAPWRTVDPTEMDADHMAIACTNGTIRVRKVEDVENANSDEARYMMKVDFTPPRREDLITKLVPAAYDPAAKCPTFDAFLEKFQPDPVMRKFLQTWCGYSLTGLTDEQAVLYHFGTGANGKSTFTEAMLRLFGPYAQNLNPESISGSGQRRGDQASPEIAQLPGKRVVIVAELPAGEQIKESLIKALTGGDRQQARHLNKGFFDFYPCFKAQMSGNSLPTIYGTDYGIWRRLRIVPWVVKIEDHEKRPMGAVLAEFEAEHSGMLNWLLKGLEIYLTEGLSVPEAVTSLTAEYRDEVDVIGRFVNACLVRLDQMPDDPGHGLPAGNLFKVFEAWCHQNGIKPKSMTKFGTEMNAKGVAKVQRGGNRYYVGVELSPDAPQPADEDDKSFFRKDDPPYGGHRGG